jgi:hypothetical protein
MPLPIASIPHKRAHESALQSVSRILFQLRPQQRASHTQQGHTLTYSCYTRDGTRARTFLSFFRSRGSACASQTAASRRLSGPAPHAHAVQAHRFPVQRLPRTPCMCWSVCHAGAEAGVCFESVLRYCVFAHWAHWPPKEYSHVCVCVCDNM